MRQIEFFLEYNVVFYNLEYCTVPQMIPNRK